MYQLMSTSAALAADGLINIEACKKVAASLTAAANKSEPVVKYSKAKSKDFPVMTKVVVAVKTKKEANALKKMVEAQGETIDKVTVTGEAGKFVIAFGATSAAEAKKAYTALTKAPGLVPQPDYYYVISAKSKIEKPNAAKFKNKDVKHLAKRAVKIVKRTKIKAGVVVLLPVYGKGVIPKSDALIRATEKEILKHIAKSEKVKVLVTKLRGDLRDERSAALTALITELTPILVAGGVKETDIVVSQGMMGQTLSFRTPGKAIANVSLGNIAAFNKAKKAAVPA